MRKKSKKSQRNGLNYRWVCVKNSACSIFRRMRKIACVFTHAIWTVLLNNVCFIYSFDACVKSHAIFRSKKIATHPIWMYPYKVVLYYGALIGTLSVEGITRSGLNGAKNPRSKLVTGVMYAPHTVSVSSSNMLYVSSLHELYLSA